MHGFYTALAALLAALLSLATIPFMLVNVFGIIVAGIWLTYLGQWRVIGVGLLVLLSGRFVIKLVLLPSFIFALPGVTLMRRGQTVLGVIVAIPGELYTSVVIVAWCYAIFVGSIAMSSEGTAAPILLWSHAIATGPWAFMARQESAGQTGYNASVAAAVFISIGYLLMVCMRLFGGAAISTCLSALVAVIIVAFIVQMSFAVPIWLATPGKGVSS